MRARPILFALAAVAVVLSTEVIRSAPLADAQPPRAARARTTRPPLPPAAATKPGPRIGEWRTYGGDLSSTRYSPLDQITGQNFNTLRVAWRFKTESLGPRPDYSFQSTPLMVGGVVYSTAGTRRSVVALDAATGELLWMHREDEGVRGTNAPRQGAGRGLAYWSNADGSDARIIYVTPGYRLIALDARTGSPVASFGIHGVVDLKLNDDQDVDLDTTELGLNATPLVAGDVVVVGAAHRAGSVPKTHNNARGYVRGFDARTGRRLWIFHTQPKRGEFGYETWLDGSAERNGNTGVWAQMSADPDLGLVYVPVEMPTGDYYGGHRPGNTLFGETLVALDLRTGERRWHYQLVHHGIWDMDIPCAPILMNLTVDGRPVKAIAQPTKQAFVYVLDRATGVPIWPIEERPVAQSDVPDEKTSPTQPFPTRPAAFDRQGVSIDDLIDYTPQLRAEAERFVARYKMGPLFTPPVVSKAEGPLATLTLPSQIGGANWPGGAFDPETNRFYIHSMTQIFANGLVEPMPGQSDMRFVKGIARSTDGSVLGTDTPSIEGLPLVKPPYDRLTAYDMNRGEIIWQKPHSSTPDTIRNHPALKGVALPERTGEPGRPFLGTLVTKTLVVIGDGGFHTNASGQRGALLRAYDKASGADAGGVFMPAPQVGSPITYLHNGKQYIVLAISGGNYPGELIAFALP